METYEFSLTAPMGQEERTIEEQAAHIRPLIQKQESFHIEMRNGKPPLGIEAILKQKPTDRPKSPSKSPRKRFQCKNKKKLQERLEQYRDFTDRYKEAHDQFRKASQKRRRFHGEWPIGSYPPGSWLPIGYQESD